MAFAPILAGNVALASILHAISPLLALAAVATLAFSMHAWLARLTRYIAGARAGLPLEQLHRHLTRRPGHHPVHTPAAEVAPPAWVAIPAAGHKGRAALDHRLCIARHQSGTAPPPAGGAPSPPAGSASPEAGGTAASPTGSASPEAGGTAASPTGGAPVTLGFSDGTARAWPSATRVSAQPYAEVEPPARSAEAAARRAESAAAFESLVRDLSRNGSTPLESVIKNHAEEHPERAVHHAVQAAVLWGLIATADGRDTQRLYALLAEPDPAEAAGIALTITQAGRLWLDCDPRRSAGPGRRAQREPARTRKAPGEPEPARGTPRGPAPAGEKPGEAAPAKDKPGEATSAGDARTGDVLTALAEVLRIPEVWERPGLRQAHDTIAVAVAGGHPDTPAVRSAADQVLTLAGGLVLGVAGTGAYDVLRVFAA